jgi:type IV pilus assembly protein PilC
MRSGLAPPRPEKEQGMATAAAAKGPKEFIFAWEGKDKAGRIVRGELRATGEAVVNHTLRRQGILVQKVKKQKVGRGGKVKDKDITLFTRQLATMMKAGVPLLQSFDIVGKGAANPAVGKLVHELKTDVETGSALAQAFRKYPLYFDALFCNLVAAGEQAGILETLLDRLATYKEKILAIKSKIKSALFYPIAIIVVAFVITAVIMIFVIPAFKQVFTSFGADLPAPTLLVMAISDWFVANWYFLFPAVGGGVWGFLEAWKRSVPVQIFMDRLMLRLPVFGDLVRKSTIARWTRTLSTMFAAGVPLVEALESVGGASGNHVYHMATRKIQGEVSTGTSLTVAMQNTNVFPSMVIQMCSIGEETGALDAMLSKVADFYEAEVDDAVEALSSLMEPMIMVVLGTLIGGMVIAMYLPIFKMGQAV